MSNRALPNASYNLLLNNLQRCQNLGLILDKYAPWGQDRRGQWDLQASYEISRRGQPQTRSASGGEAMGLWLSTSGSQRKQQPPSVFEEQRTDKNLMREYQDRWGNMVRSGNGLAFTLTSSERLAVGLGASHVLETALTLDRNTGLPYIPGSTLKGLARAWGLIEVANALGIKLEDASTYDEKNPSPLNKLSDFIIDGTIEKAYQEPNKKKQEEAFERIHKALKIEEITPQAKEKIDRFSFVFGSQQNAGAVNFVDGIYNGEKAPTYETDVMTPHYKDYYGSGGKSAAPSEDDNPNPVSFLTIGSRQKFAFGVLPRQSAWRETDAPLGQRETVETAAAALIDGLTKLGVGSKTAAGYGFFRSKSLELIIEMP